MSKCITVILVLLYSTSSIFGSHHVEIPTDLLYPCEMNGYDLLPIQQTELSDNADIRFKRQQKVSLGYKIDDLRNICASTLGIAKKDIPEDLLNVDNPTPEIKCLMTCILQRLQLMTKNNLISTRGIKRLADDVGNSNPLVTAIAVALAQNFNERLAAKRITDQCEAGYLINKYIAKEMKDRKLQVPY